MFALLVCLISIIRVAGFLFNLVGGCVVYLVTCLGLDCYLFTCLLW